MKRAMNLVFLLLLPAAAFSENFSGKWLIENETPFGRVRTILQLNQVGDQVRGTMRVVEGAPFLVATSSPPQIEVRGAIVTGNTLTFYMWTGRDEPVKDVYKGVLTDARTITFDVERGVGPPPAVPASPAGEAKFPFVIPPEPTRLTAVRTL